MARLIAKTSARGIPARRIRTWEDEGFEGMREAEAREAKSQRDSDAREKAERDRDSTRSGSDKPSATKSAASSKKSLGERIWGGIKSVARVGAAVATGGLSETALGVGKAMKGYMDRSAAKAGINRSTSRTSSGQARPGPGNAPESNRGSNDGPGVVRSTALRAQVSVPIHALTVTPSTVTPRTVTPRTVLVNQPPDMQAVRYALPETWQGSSGEVSWMDQQMIPGVRNLYLALGAGGLAVLLVAKGGKGKVKR